MMRTTCIATQFEGGHAPNALPQRARVNVNCRILPGVSVDAVHADLIRVIGDAAIAVRVTGEKRETRPVPPLTPAIMEPIKTLAKNFWPEAQVGPIMATGGTDGSYLNIAGIPTYGISGIFTSAEPSGAHGLNERVLVRSVMDARQFLQELVRAYAEDKS